MQKRLKKWIKEHHSLLILIVMAITLISGYIGFSQYFNKLNDINRNSS